MNTNNLPTEQQLLLCVARRNLEADEIVRLRDLVVTQPLDWKRLQNTAVDHGLLPLLALHITSHCADLLQPDVLNRLRAELFTNRESNLYLVSELVRVLARFKSADIDVLAFKGPVLGQIAYEDIGFRQAGDLDILIHAKDFNRATELLRDLAYKMHPQLSPAQAKAHLRFHCATTFVREDSFSVVDLHWGITPKTFPLALTSEDFLSNRKTIHLGSHSIETLTDEDLIFYLSVHAAKHYFRSLEWMTTLFELIRNRPELSWSAVIARARQAKAERIICLALMLVESLYGLPVPAEFAELSNSTELRDTVSKILAFLLANNSEPNALQAFCWKLRFLPTRDACLSLVRATLVPTISDWRAFSIPDAIYPAYYLLRPFRLLAKWGGGAEP